MPKARPPTSGYARLAQTEEEDALDRDDPFRGQAASSASQRHEPIQPERRGEAMQQQHPSGRSSPTSSRRRPPRRQRSNSGVDIKAINARLERWADEIASKFKLKRGKGNATDGETLEIQHSVFQAPDWISPATAEVLETDYAESPGLRLSKIEFDDIVESVRVAIELGIQPKLISQGSSGSYFARNSEGKTVAVFKPKDEEPYASRNPKWTKWIHRNLFPFFFGRACLIPNLSYISEAAAYVLDAQLRCNLVPYTDIVSLSSKSFSYDFWDRRAYYRKKKALPEKQGSFQIFLKGYKDASLFLKEHPWPDQQGGFHGDAISRRKRKRRWAEDCRPSGPQSDDEDDLENPTTAEEENRRRNFWTVGLQQSFREQLEKLVILDYIMRNTDRGLDNWMIRIDQKTEKAQILVDPPNASDATAGPGSNGHITSFDEPYRRLPEHMVAVSRTGTPLNAMKDESASVRIGAIDNSLSWPWKHPDAWRSYPFGWLFLPVAMIGQPFSEATRRHFLPLLTSKKWWSDTQLALRSCFTQDDDFQEKMYAKQVAVMKGQAWNVVETLKTSDHGPLELTRRSRVYVWDDLVEVPVAVPLRTQSSEIRRKQPLFDQSEEMDIGASGLSAPEAQPVALPTTTSPSEEAQSNRFNTSRQTSFLDIQEANDANDRTLSPPNVRAISNSVDEQPGSGSRASSRPPLVGHRSRMSFDDVKRLREGPGRNRQRDRRLSHSARFDDYDDIEGDLGYAAAEGMDAVRKKVIVERLEPVKSKNPVFTWC